MIHKGGLDITNCSNFDPFPSSVHIYNRNVVLFNHFVYFGRKQAHLENEQQRHLCFGLKTVSRQVKTLQLYDGDPHSAKTACWQHCVDYRCSALY